MKILFVTHRYPPRTGGVETHVREIATQLVERGDEVTVFSADAGNDVLSEEVVEGVHVRRFRSLNPDSEFYFAPQLSLAVRRETADVIHAHNYHAFPLFFAALGVTDEQFVVTTHYHAGSTSEGRDALLSLYRPIGGWAVRRANEVVAVSEWERDQLQSDFGVEATVLPNGVVVDRFAGAAAAQRNRPYLLTVGRLEKYKGVQHVIRAMTALPEYDLLIAGSGSHRGELEQIARDEGVTAQVEFLGYVDDETLPRLYAGADVYVTMSEFEAYGMTVAEALAAGTPCVVRDVAALQDWTENRCVVGVSTVSSESIRQAVRSTDRTSNPMLKNRSWEVVTTRLVQEVYMNEASTT